MCARAIARHGDRDPVWPLPLAPFSMARKTGSPSTALASDACTGNVHSLQPTRKASAGEARRLCQRTLRRALVRTRRLLGNPLVPWTHSFQNQLDVLVFWAAVRQAVAVQASAKASARVFRGRRLSGRASSLLHVREHTPATNLRGVAIRRGSDAADDGRQRVLVPLICDLFAHHCSSRIHPYLPSHYP